MSKVDSSFSRTHSYSKSPNLRMKKRIFSPISSHLDSRYSKRREILKSLRNRGRESVSVTETSISTAISKYIMPMFEGKHIRNKTPELKGSVYKELKLSQQLCFRNEELNDSIERLETEVKELRQSHHQKEEKSQFYIEENISIRQTLDMVNHEYSCVVDSFKDKLKKQTFLQNQIEQYKHMFDKITHENEELQALVREEKASNDKYKFQAIQFQHEIALLQIANQILAEQIKGLYESTRDTSSNTKVLAEFNDFFLSLKNNGENIDELEQMLWKIKRESHVYLNHADTLKECWKIKENKYEKYIQALRKELAESFKAKEVIIEHNKNLKERILDLEKKLQILQKEYEYINGKIKKFREDEDKICKHCLQPFTETENYNWSCKRHASLYTNNIYFCCGKTQKDSIGCLQSKHEAKEDVNFTEQNTPTTSFCSSCKMNGHTHYQCSKDPNIRSKFPIESEIIRIIKNSPRKEKREIANHQFTIQKRMIHLLNPRQSLVEDSESDIIIDQTPQEAFL